MINQWDITKTVYAKYLAVKLPSKAKPYKIDLLFVRILIAIMVSIK